MNSSHRYIIDGGNASTDNTSLSPFSNSRPLHTTSSFRNSMIVVHYAVFLLAVFGNALVITTLLRHKRMRTVTNVFLLNLAFSDILVAVVCMPFTVIPVLMQDFVFGEVTCIVVRYLQGVTVAASAFTLVALSMERYFAICRPLSAREWQVLSHSYKMIAVIWTFAFILNVPLAIHHKTTETKGIRQCTDIWESEVSRKAWYCFQLICVDLFMPLVVMSVAYSLIANELWTNVDFVSTGTPAKAIGERVGCDDFTLKPSRWRRIFIRTRAPLVTTTQHTVDDSSGMRSHSSTSTAQSKRSVIKMLLVVVVEFFICWTPLYVVSTWYMLDFQSAAARIPSPPATMTALRLLAYTSSCCNPITYSFMSSTFRTAFLKVFSCPGQRPRICEPQSPVTQTSDVECYSKINTVGQFRNNHGGSGARTLEVCKEKKRSALVNISLTNA